MKSRTVKVSRMIDQPHRAADQVVPELEHPLAGVDQRAEDVLASARRPVGCERGSGPRRSRPRRGSRDCSAGGASRRGRFRAAHRSGEPPPLRTGSRTGGTCSARQGGRDRPLVEADRRDQERAHGGHDSFSRPRARPASASTDRSACSMAPSPPSRASSPAAGRATITKSWPWGQVAGAGPEGVAQQPLDPIALDGAAELATDGDPEPRLLILVGARKRVDDQVAAGVRAALAVDAVELAATRQPAALAARAVGHSPRA